MMEEGRCGEVWRLRWLLMFEKYERSQELSWHNVPEVNAG